MTAFVRIPVPFEYRFEALVRGRDSYASFAARRCVEVDVSSLSASDVEVAAECVYLPDGRKAEPVIVEADRFGPGHRLETIHADDVGPLASGLLVPNDCSQAGTRVRWNGLHDDSHGSPGGFGRHRSNPDGYEIVSLLRSDKEARRRRASAEASRHLVFVDGILHSARAVSCVASFRSRDGGGRLGLDVRDVADRRFRRNEWEWPEWVSLVVSAARAEEVIETVGFGRTDRTVPTVLAEMVRVPASIRPDFDLQLASVAAEAMRFLRPPASYRHDPVLVPGSSCLDLPDDAEEAMREGRRLMRGLDDAGHVPLPCDVVERALAWLEEFPPLLSLPETRFRYERPIAARARLAELSDALRRWWRSIEAPDRTVAGQSIPDEDLEVAGLLD